MEANTHENQFVGKVPGMDCKSEWLLAYGSNDFMDNSNSLSTSNDNLEVTFIVKMDKAILPLFTELNAKGSNRWYVFVDGKIIQGNSPTFKDEVLKEPLDPDRYLLAYMGIEELKRARKSSGVNDDGSGYSIESGLIMTTALRRRTDDWPEFNVVHREDTVLDRNSVIIGIIDDGIAVAHERFRNADGKTRVRHFWDQRARTKSNAVERSLPYGQEIDDNDINKAIEKGDEQAFYRDALSELSDSNEADTRLMRAVNHGTHVLDLATGGHADDTRPIIAVQLPPRTVADTSGVTFFEQHVMAGLLYILDRAKQYKIVEEDGSERCVPIVVNFSFGTVAGPHDGTHQLERLFDGAVAQQAGEKRDLRMIIPAGNSHQSRCHAEFPVTKDAQSELFWRLQPEDRSASWLHIWLPPEELWLSELWLSKDKHNNRECPFELTITPPGGSALTGPVSKDKSLLLHADNNEGQVIGLATYTVTRSEHPRGHLCITLRPTANLEADESARPVAPSGLWRIALKLKPVMNEHVIEPVPPVFVQAWIERDDTAFGYRQHGRQSYFDHPDYEVYDSQGRPNLSDVGNESLVKRGGLINAIATGRNTVVVGAARADNNKPSGYSAGGPLRYTFPGKPVIDRTGIDSTCSEVPVARNGVDLLAIADDSAIHGGVIAAGTHSGSTAMLNGTSVAAPQVARVVADDLAAGRTKTLSALQSKCAAPEGSAASVRSGFGTIDNRLETRRREKDSLSQ